MPFLLEDETRGGPEGVSELHRTPGNLCDPSVGLGNLVHSPAAIQVADLPEDLQIELQRAIQEGSHHVARDIVGRGPESARDDGQIDLENVGEGPADLFFPIPHRVAALHGNPQGRELSPDPRGIGVNRLARQQLVSDGHDCRVDPSAGARHTPEETLNSGPPTPSGTATGSRAWNRW